MASAQARAAMIESGYNLLEQALPFARRKRRLIKAGSRWAKRKIFRGKLPKRSIR